MSESSDKVPSDTTTDTFGNEVYDSMIPHLDHINKVQENILQFVTDMIHRGNIHDRSKFDPEEKAGFDREGANLKNLTVNTPEYKASLERLGETLQHHYAENSHHPEHYTNGVAGMTLADLVEMVADWKAASERNRGGTLNLDSSFDRFNLDPQLRSIIKNTCKEYGWI